MATQAATETMPDLPIGRNYKRRRLFLVERAVGFEIAAGWPHLQIAPQEIDNIDLLLYAFGWLHVLNVKFKNQNVKLTSVEQKVEKRLPF